MLPPIELNNTLVLFILNISKIGSFLQSKSRYLPEHWLLSLVEILPWIGEVEEGVVADGNSFGPAWILSPEVQVLRGEEDGGEDGLFDQDWEVEEGEEGEGEEEEGAEGGDEVFFMDWHI